MLYIVFLPSHREFSPCFTQCNVPDLMWAVKQDSMPRIKTLIEQDGVDINERSVIVSSTKTFHAIRHHFIRQSGSNQVSIHCTRSWSVLLLLLLGS